MLCDIITPYIFQIVMLDQDHITSNIIQQVEQLVQFRFAEFYNTLDPVISFRGQEYRITDVLYEDLVEHYKYGSYLFVEEYMLNTNSDENPYCLIAMEAGWMAMQDIQYREGQVLPYDNNY